MVVKRRHLHLGKRVGCYSHEVLMLMFSAFTEVFLLIIYNASIEWTKRCRLENCRLELRSLKPVCYYFQFKKKKKKK